MTQFCGAYSYFTPKRERKWAFWEANEHGYGGMSGNMTLERVFERFSMRGIVLSTEEKTRLETGGNIDKALGCKQK